MTSLLAVDPGSTTGWAYWRNIEVKMPSHIGEVKYDEVYPWIDNWVVDFIVGEDYIIRPKYMAKFEHNWNKGYALRILGALELKAIQLKAEFILQQPSQKPIGYTLLGGKYEKGKKPKGIHSMDAAAHGAVAIARINPWRKAEKKKT